MSKKARIIAAVAALLVVAAVAAYALVGAKGSGPEVETAKVTKKELAVRVTASGEVDAGVRADVFPPAAGTLEEIYVSDGASVTAGQKIALMDTGPLELQVAQAKAAQSQAEAQLESIEQQKPGTADLTAAKANVSAAYGGYLAAKKALAGIGTQAPSAAQLSAAAASTQLALDAYTAAKTAAEALPASATLAAARDQAYVAYLTAKAGEEKLTSVDLSSAKVQAQAAVQQAYAAWKGAQAQLAKLRNADTDEARAAAEAGIRQASEALSIAQKALDDATLVAPIDGTVIFSAPGAAAAALGGGGGKPTKGSAVSPQSAPFSVVDLSALRFTAEVDEADIDRVKVGMHALVTLDAFTGVEFETTVVRVNPVAQATATGGTVFEVELSLGDTPRDVLIGMKGDAQIEVSSREGALTVPIEALFSEGGTDYVYVVSGGKLKKTVITVGATTDTEVEVLSGLDEGQVVALSGSVQYADGMAVRQKSK